MHSYLKTPRTRILWATLYAQPQIFIWGLKYPNRALDKKIFHSDFQLLFYLSRIEDEDEADSIEAKGHSADDEAENEEIEEREEGFSSATSSPVKLPLQPKNSRPQVEFCIKTSFKHNNSKTKGSRVGFNYRCIGIRSVRTDFFFLKKCNTNFHRCFFVKKQQLPDQ